jgi:hypothetical protein
MDKRKQRLWNLSRRYAQKAVSRNPNMPAEPLISVAWRKGYAAAIATLKRRGPIAKGDK